MAIEFPDQKTPVTTGEMAAALAESWYHYFGSYVPGVNPIKVLLAQWALETGWGKSMHCYNIGNIKAGADVDHCYFACNELMNTATAKRIYAKDLAMGTAKITTEKADGTCWIWFYPKHAGCRFRAYESLNAGTYDYLKLLITHKTFNKTWPAVEAGDPVKFSQLLHDAGYYTAPVSTYTAGVLRIFNSLSNVTIPDDLLFNLTEVEKAKMLNDVYASIQESYHDENSRDPSGQGDSP